MPTEKSPIYSIKLLLLLSISSLLYFQLIPLYSMWERIDNPWQYSVNLFIASFCMIIGIFTGTNILIRSSESIWTVKATDIFMVPLLIAFLPLLVFSLLSINTIIQNGYGATTTISKYQNILFYVALTLMPFYMFHAREKPVLYFIIIVSILVPRIVVSTVGQRFFALQALIPLFIFWCLRYKISVMKIITHIFIGFIIASIILPSLRGDTSLGFDNIIEGSPINLNELFNESGVAHNMSAARLFFCQLFVSVYDYCDLEKIWIVPDDLSYRYNNVLSGLVRNLTGNDGIGTGGNPILEGWPNGELNFFGPFIFYLIGFVTGIVTRNSLHNSFCCFLLPHVTAKILFLWRGTIVEFFDRLHLIALSYLCLYVIFTIKDRYSDAKNKQFN